MVCMGGRLCGAPSHLFSEEGCSATLIAPVCVRNMPCNLPAALMSGGPRLETAIAFEIAARIRGHSFEGLWSVLGRRQKKKALFMEVHGRYKWLISGLKGHLTAFSQPLL